VAALVVFTIGSGLCALSRSAGALIACRVLQGLGGGAILPAGTMIWTSQASKAQMARVMSLIGIPVVLAPMLGPTLGGLLIQGPGWQAIFWINVPSAYSAWPWPCGCSPGRRALTPGRWTCRG
jgi:MFS family permease